MTTTRTRITWRGQKGARKPDGTVIVAKPSRWGNPFDWRIHGKPKAVQLFRDWTHQPEQAEYREAARRDLKGKALACYCKPNEPCHSDVLVAIAEQ